MVHYFVDLQRPGATLEPPCWSRVGSLSVQTGETGSTRCSQVPPASPAPTPGFPPGWRPLMGVILIRSPNHLNRPLSNVWMLELLAVYLRHCLSPEEPHLRQDLLPSVATQSSRPQVEVRTSMDRASSTQRFNMMPIIQQRLPQTS